MTTKPFHEFFVAQARGTGLLFDEAQQGAEERRMVPRERIGVELRTVLVRRGASPNGPSSRESISAARQRRLGVSVVRCRRDRSRLVASADSLSLL